MDQASYLSRTRIITVSLVATGFSLMPTLYVALISNSLTLVADLLRCAVEFIAILLAFIIARKTRPENLQYYNYGFGKLEHFSSLIVAGAMLLVFLIISVAAIKRLIAPEIIENSELGLYLAILSITGNIYIWQKNKKLAQKTSSPIISAQAKLFLSKTIACTVVVLSLTAGILFKNNFLGHYSDILGSVLVAAFLLYSSYNMIFLSLSKILDASLEEGAQLIILKSLVKFEMNYKNISRIRTRHGGEKNYIEIWLEFDNSKSLSEVHTTGLQIQKEIEGQIPASEVIIIPLPA